MDVKRFDLLRLEGCLCVKPSCRKISWGVCVRRHREHCLPRSRRRFNHWHSRCRSLGSQRIHCQNSASLPILLHVLCETIESRLAETATFTFPIQFTCLRSVEKGFE